MRKSADTRGAEGKFGGFRCNRLAASNTVNFPLKGASEKAAADFRREEAKAATRPLGIGHVLGSSQEQERDVSSLCDAECSAR